jgi:stage II sporulation protein D
LNGRKKRRGQAGIPGVSLGGAFACGAIIAVILWIGIHPGEDETRKTSPRTERAEGQSQDAGTGRRTAREPQGEPGKEEAPAYTQPSIKVYLSETGEIEKVPLEAYVEGVVAAEMPSAFQPAALEAQAVAARTFAVRRLWMNDHAGTPKGADVTDTEAHQVYRSLQEMKRLKLDDAEAWRKTKEAAERTAGAILVYEGEPIQALFFSTSNGYTENSEEAFSTRLPYLRSVPSPWDKEDSPRAKETIEMKLADFYAKLGIEAQTVGKREGEEQSPRVLEWTQGRRVKTLLAGDRKLSGVEARRRLGLRSASFEWRKEGDSIQITVYGSGHGVGMSQWGAEGMARAGKDSRQILKYYYKGVSIEQVSKLAKRAENRL